MRGKAADKEHLRPGQEHVDASHTPEGDRSSSGVLCGPELIVHMRPVKQWRTRARVVNIKRATPVVVVPEQADND